MPTFRAENIYYRQGLTLVAGLDEVGRGAWAGPFVVGAVILPEPTRVLRLCLKPVDDSKRLSAEQREACAAIIRAQALAYAVGVVSASEVDALGLTLATRAAMSRAIAALRVQPQALLLDAFPLPCSPLPQRAIIRGDSYSFSIAAASIIAKVARDAMMRALDEEWPQYGFASHKGYGTAAHRAALAQHGATLLHRRSFAPIRAFAPDNQEDTKTPSYFS